MRPFRLETGVAMLCLWICLPLESIPAQDRATVSDLAPLRASYGVQLEKINKTSTAAITNLQNQYVKSLAALEKSFQDQGKLEPLLAVKKERERFAAGPGMESANVVADVPELSAIQLNYIKASEGLPLKKAKDTIALAEQYRKSLTGLQGQLTKAGNLDAAIEVKKEIEALEDRPEVTASRFALADAEANKPPEPAKQETAPVATNPPSSKKTSQVTSKKKYTGKPETCIRQRFKDLCDVLLKQDMDKAVEFVDPRIVKERGTDQVRSRLRMAFPFLRFTEAPGVKFGSGDIKVDDKDETATMIPRIWVNNAWHEMNAIPWVQVDGDWFLALDTEQRPRQGDFPPRPRHGL